MAGIIFGWWARDAGIAPGMAALGLAALLLHPAFYEISASATNVQWIAAVGILMTVLIRGSTLAPRLGIVAPFVLACGLTGVPTSMLAPAFLVRGAVERSRPHWVLGTILAATAVLQLGTILLHPLPGRGLTIDPLAMTTGTVLQTVWASLFGLPVRYLGRIAGGQGLLAAVVTVVLVLGAIMVVSVAARAARRGGASRLVLTLTLGSWAGVSILNVFGALGSQAELLQPPAGSRYLTLGIAAGIVLVLLATRSPWRRDRQGATAILVWMTLLGIAQTMVPDFSRHLSQGPDWQAEIVRCRATPGRACAARIWPATPPGTPPWVLDLPPDRLSAIGTASHPTIPRKESSWLA